ncbi:MAG: hypothetical protein MJ101_01910 [Clostridia bacterium]|nr:hypothetical protein [Clostridia bacterium]
MTDIISYHGTVIAYLSIDDGMVPDELREFTGRANESFTGAVRTAAEEEITALTHGTREMRAKFKPVYLSLGYSLSPCDGPMRMTVTVTVRRGKSELTKRSDFFIDGDAHVFVSGKKAKKCVAKDSII